MKELLKNIGPIFILIGVVLLAFYYFSQSNKNIYLVSAGVIMVVGFFAHVIINKSLK